MTPKVGWLEKLVALDPALVRGIIVSAFGMFAMILNQTVLPESVNTTVDFVVGLLALVAAVIIRPAVTPNAKVVVYDDTPLDETATIKAGEAVAIPTDMHAVEKAARRDGYGFEDDDEIEGH